MRHIFKGFDPFKWSESQIKDKFDPFHWLENQMGNQMMPPVDSGFFEQHVKEVMDQTLAFNRGESAGEGSGPAPKSKLIHETFDLMEYVVVKILLPDSIDLSSLSLYYGQSRLVVFNRADQTETVIPLPVPVRSNAVTARYRHPVIEVTLLKNELQEQLREISIMMDQA
ncbi:hypothetical protein [Fictibacillus fluitans]|uniref:Uncharacterized protein n=1 Tax=Fictibacillus fluitans TaxID=3058422 RepID=A0ABT8I139_9BACL|nr:hypothetical protein [Fictibacillus sp. NE201]MDN4526703.1 hypothetical protein [Fictibacillus sp. NE201]